MSERFKIVSLGIDYPDYFQGFGVSFTPFEHCAVGIGDTEAEAYEDACEQIAMAESSAEFESLGLPDEWGDADESISDSGIESDSDAHYYVGIRYNKT